MCRKLQVLLALGDPANEHFVNEVQGLSAFGGISGYITITRPVAAGATQAHQSSSAPSPLERLSSYTHLGSTTGRTP